MKNILKVLLVLTLVFIVSVKYSHAQVITAVSVSTTSCPVIKSEMLRIGGSNDLADVIRLQTFLKETEKLDVDANGIFDQKTESAVKVFQKKYQDVILAPWHATKASGVAYITTIKKINDLACGQKMILDAKELAKINNYKDTSTSTMTSENMSGPSMASSTTVGAENMAAIPNVTGGSLASRFWYFLKHLF